MSIEVGDNGVPNFSVPSQLHYFVYLLSFYYLADSIHVLHPLSPLCSPLINHPKEAVSRHTIPPSKHAPDTQAVFISPWSLTPSLCQSFAKPLISPFCQPRDPYHSSDELLFCRLQSAFLYCTDKCSLKMQFAVGPSIVQLISWFRANTLQLKLL